MKKNDNSFYLSGFKAGNRPLSYKEVSAGKMFYNCHVGVVLTNSAFTYSAISLAEATGVLLWGRTELAKLMEKW